MPKFVFPATLEEQEKSSQENPLVKRFAESRGVINIMNINIERSTKHCDDIMSLPQRLSLIEKDELGIEPAGDMKSLRYNHKQIKNMTLPANTEKVLDNIKGNAMEIKAEIDPENASSVMLKVLRSS